VRRHFQVTGEEKRNDFNKGLMVDVAKL